MSEQTIEQLIGDPKKLDAELEEFRKSAKLLSSKRAHLIVKYPKRWVAIYGGRVRADARSLNQILSKIDELGMPREHVIVRYIDKNLRRMIL